LFAESSSPLLPGLESADQDALRAICAPRTLSRGEAFYIQGDETAGLLFPRSGLMRTSAGVADGEGVLAALIGPGGIVGLSAALTGRVCDSATALTEVVGLTTDGARLRRLAAERPGLALVLAGVAAGQTAESQEELACYARHRIEQRLARLLLRLAAHMGGSEVLVTQDDLADMLAVQRTTVTALASRLKDVGILAYARGRIRILDRERIVRLACGCPQT